VHIDYDAAVHHESKAVHLHHAHATRRRVESDSVQLVRLHTTSVWCVWCTRILTTCVNWDHSKKHLHALWAWKIMCENIVMLHELPLFAACYCQCCVRFQVLFHAIECVTFIVFCQVQTISRPFVYKSMQIAVFAAYTSLTDCTLRRSCPQSSSFSCPSRRTRHNWMWKNPRGVFPGSRKREKYTVQVETRSDIGWHYPHQEDGLLVDSYGHLLSRGGDSDHQNGFRDGFKVPSDDKQWNACHTTRTWN